MPTNTQQCALSATIRAAIQEIEQRTGLRCGVHFRPEQALKLRLDLEEAREWWARDG